MQSSRVLRPLDAAYAAPLLQALGDVHTATSIFCFRDNCPELLPIPAGPHVIGELPNLWSPAYGYLPRKVAKLANPVFIGRYEVTVGQYRECIAAGACQQLSAKLGDPLDSVPIRYVHWDDAKAYVRWLSGITGKTYRLPHESEWEIAARAGTYTNFWWGDEFDSELAGVSVSDSEADSTIVIVGTTPANPWGFHEVIGNVSEWTETCFDSSPYFEATGTIDSSRPCTARVLKGGNFSSPNEEFLRVSKRLAGRTDYENVTGTLFDPRMSIVGLRVARD